MQDSNRRDLNKMKTLHSSELRSIQLLLLTYCTTSDLTTIKRTWLTTDYTTDMIIEGFKFEHEFWSKCSQNPCKTAVFNVLKSKKIVYFRDKFL